MMAIEERAAPLRAKRPNQHQTPESTTRCAFCGEGRDVYQMSDKWICTDHLAASVSLAASAVWPDMVHYSREFEKVLL